MKACARCCSLLLVISLVHIDPANLLAATIADDAPKPRVYAELDVQQHAASPMNLATDGQPTSPDPKVTGEAVQRPYEWKYGFYPVLAWVPIFGASVTLPPTPSHPISGPTATTNNSFNGAYFGGGRFEVGKWSADVTFMWAALQAERENPFASVKLDFVFGGAMGGREVLPNLYAEGGFRRLALNVHATVQSDAASSSPGYWDPLLGLTYRKTFGNKWRVLVHGDGGGFGVGSDVDVSATARGEWQFTRHVGVAMGYGGLHLSETSTKNGESFKLAPTLHGPLFGVGIFF